MSESIPPTGPGPEAGPTPVANGRLPIEDIFPPHDYQHRLRLARGDVRAFFGSWHRDTAVLTERRLWLASHPDRHAVALPEAIPVLRETALWFRDLGLGDLPEPVETATAWCTAVGGMVEPDLLWLTRSADSPPSTARRAAAPLRMIAGAVAGPSSWAPESKLGHDLRFIHDIVPELNRDLGNPIDTFLARLRPGVAWLRANWGMSASPDLNQHPARGLPRLRSPLHAGNTWIRIEHQALTALPDSGTILFGIRVENLRLSELAAHPVARAGLAQALRTMPEPMAHYKGLAPVRSELLEVLGQP